MFVFDLLTGAINMHAGDTGTATYNISGATLGENDRVLWTMTNQSGVIVKQNALTADANNDVTVNFANADTDELPAGTYRYDMRVVINPQYETVDGEQVIVDGDDVTTLSDPMTVTIKSTIGKV